MAETLLLAAKALFAAVGCCAGWQLAQLARRPEGAPLHAWASAMICVGAIGVAGFALGPLLAERSAPAARWMMIVSDALERLSLLGLAVFVWRIGGAGAARMVLLGAVMVAMNASWTLALVVQQWPEPLLSQPVRVTSQLAFALPFVWSTGEALLAVRRERAAGDPVAANRFLLWMLGSASLASICFATVAVLLLPAGSPFAPALSGLRAALYALVSACVVLALFPPAGYLRWLSGSRPLAARA
jgi:hypothetical protein